jgi:hypothetical protein
MGKKHSGVHILDVLDLLAGSTYTYPVAMATPPHHLLAAHGTAAYEARSSIIIIELPSMSTNLNKPKSSK